MRPGQVAQDDAGTARSTRAAAAETVSRNSWEAVLERLRPQMPEEDFRRWFAATAYASDSGDQITVWVPSESIRRHVLLHFQEAIDRALAASDRPEVEVRLVVSGTGEDDEDDEDGTD
jgi:chromosomal replication initiation ATPase DnaA